MKDQKVRYTNPLFVIVFAATFFFWTLSSSCDQKENSVASINNQKLPDKVDFNFHIKPILSDRCFTCHGPDANTREAGLRFDTKEGAFAALGENKDHHAIVANDTAKSTLIYRVNTEDPDDIMPPPESNLTLSDYEKQLLSKWIEQGAEWKEHWSFLPIEKPEIPKSQKATSRTQ